MRIIMITTLWRATARLNDIDVDDLVPIIPRMTVG